MVWTFGTEYYGNLKNVVRGLCAEIAPDDELFLHGCALMVNGHGVVIAGRSGVGKTTLTAALRRKLGSAVKIVNEDWGPFSLRTGKIKFTGQPYLHKKYASVRSIAPELSISPDTHPSESFNGEQGQTVQKPDFEEKIGFHRQAHLLISPTELFGADSLQDEGILQLYVVAVRNPAEPAMARRLSPADVDIIERGQYSDLYRRTAWFLNGALFLFDEERRARVREQHETLLERYHCIVLNNTGSAAEGAEMILAALEKV